MRPLVVTLAINGTTVNSSPIQLDYHVNPFNVGYGAVVVSGSPTYVIQHSFDDPQTVANPTWFNNSAGSQTASSDGNYFLPVQQVRVQGTAGTGVVTVTFLQAGIHS